MEFTNIYNLPYEIAEFLKLDFYDYPEGINASALIDPPRIYYLRERHKDEIKIDISDRLWMVWGQAVHEALAKTPLKNCIQEHRIFVDVNGIKISGKFDVFRLNKKILTDYKTTSVWTVIKQSRINEWKLQVNIYRWLLVQHGYDVDKLRIIALLRDWHKYESIKKRAYNEKYPIIPIVVIDLDMMDLNEVEEYVRRRAALFKLCEPLGDDELPVCSPKERWYNEITNTNKRCLYYCDVKEFCNFYKQIIKKEG